MPTPTECTTPAQIESATRLLEGQYPSLTPLQVQEGAALMRAEGWRMQGIFHGEDCKAVVMIRIGYRLYSGKFLQLECLYVHPDHRRDGYASLLFQHAEKIAEAEGCERLILDSYVDNANSHKFFYRHGYHICGFHFNKVPPKSI